MNHHARKPERQSYNPDQWKKNKRQQGQRPADGEKQEPDCDGEKQVDHLPFITPLKHLRLQI